MNTIKENKKNEIIINKSKFINYTYKINNKQEINTIINNIKQEYPDATHIVYAYILNNEEKKYEDKEPQNTSAKPMLELLKQNKLNNILTITIRYFGGIKLGANGLVHAYKDSLKQNLIENIKEETKAIKIKIIESYDKIQNIEYLLKDEIIESKEYKENVEIIAIIKEKNIENIKKIKYQEIEKVII